MPARTLESVVLAVLAVALAVAGSLYAPWFGGLLGLLAVLILAMLAVSRQRRLQSAADDLSRDIERLADAGLAETPAARPNSTDEVPDELDGLARQVRELRRHLATQVKELAKKTRNLESLIDGMDEPVLVTGDQETVLLCNRAAEAMLDARASSLLGRSIRELFTTADLLAMHRRARAGDPQRARVRLTTPAGVRTFQTSASPLPAAWGEGIFGVIIVLRDVTELAQAIQLQTDFVANASHELRTPVAALKASIETLQDGAKEQPELLDKLLGICDSNVTRLEEMVRDLLDLSRLQSADMPVRLGIVPVDDLKATLLVSFEVVCQRRRLQLDITVDPALGTMSSDVKLLSLVLRNLIENATKFAFENTVIRVRGQRIEAPAGPIARFTVADRGIGIPLDQQARVFERFYQVDASRTGHKPQGRGSGLGLAIVKQAVDALGGKVTMDSVYGEGTTVVVELPTNEGSARAPTPVS